MFPRPAVLGRDGRRLLAAGGYFLNFNLVLRHVPSHCPRALLLVRVRSAFLTDIPFNSFDHNSPAITTKSSSPSSARRPLKDSTSRPCELLWLDAVLEVGSPSTIDGCDPSVSCQLLAKLYASNSCFLASSMTHCSFDLPQVLRDCPTTGAGFKSRTVNSWRRLVVPHNLKHRGRLDSLFASTALRRRRSDLERAQEKKVCAQHRLAWFGFFGRSQPIVLPSLRLPLTTFTVSRCPGCPETYSSSSGVSQGSFVKPLGWGALGFNSLIYFHTWKLINTRRRREIWPRESWRKRHDRKRRAAS